MYIHVEDIYANIISSVAFKKKQNKTIIITNNIMAEKRHVQHVRSKVVENGQPKLPASGSSSPLLYGELAINYHKGAETISLRNDADEIVTFHDEVEISTALPQHVNAEIWIDTSDSAVTEVYTKQQIDSALSGFTNDINGIKEKDIEQDEEIGTLSSSTRDLGTRVGNLETTIVDKADKDEVEDIVQKVTQIESVTSAMSEDTVEEIQDALSALDNEVGELSSLTQTKLSTDVYTAYTANTAEELSALTDDVEKKLEKSDFNTYSAATEEEIASKLASDDFNTYSAATEDEIASKLATSDFESYSASTKSIIDDKFDGVEYVSSAKTIYFKSGDEVKGTVDAKDFIKDGMVDNVEIKEVEIDGEMVMSLVITFNEDAGSKEIVPIPISQIFDANNYYTIEQTDEAITQAVSTYSGDVTADLTEVNEKISANTESINQLGEKVDNIIVIGDSATTLSSDTELFVDTTEPDPFEVYTKAQVDALIANLQAQIDELKG